MQITGMKFDSEGETYVITAEAYHHIYGSEHMAAPAECMRTKFNLTVVFTKHQWDDSKQRYVPVLNSATLMLWHKIKLRSN